MKSVAQALPMPTSRIGYRWRQFATGLSFVIFGLAGILLGPLVFPPACLSAGSKREARRRAQWIVSRWFRTFSHLMRLLGVIEWRIEGADKLRRPGRMIIANHPTLIDVVLLLGYAPEVDCIVKRGLFRNPFTRVPITWAGYISNSTPSQLVADCVATLRQGRSLLIFPEGTRTVPGQAIHIPHAAARIALEAGAEVLPVTIHCDPITLTKQLPWYRVPARRSRWTITVGEPATVDAFLRDAPNKSISARRLSRHWETYFSSRTASATRTDGFE